MGQLWGPEHITQVFCSPGIMVFDFASHPSSKITADGECSHEIKMLLGSYNKPRQLIIKQRHYFANKGPSSQSYGFSSSHVWM